MTQVEIRYYAPDPELAGEELLPNHVRLGEFHNYPQQVPRM